MKSRVVAIVVAVLVPLAVVGVVVVRHDGGKRAPARLPIVVSGRSTPGAADAALAPYGGITYKQGPNLPALTGSARAYRVGASDVAGVEQSVAGALGLHGEPTADGTGALVLTDGDAQLTVTPTEWNYSRASSDNVVASGGTAVACAPDADCPADTIPPPPAPSRPADLPSQDDAKAAALAFLARTGVDTKNATVNVDDDVTEWFVRVDPVVDGTPTEGFSSSVTVGEKSVIDFASGMVGAPSATDDYPLIGTPAAVDRLNSGEGFVGPEPLGTQGVASDDVVASGIAPGEPAPPSGPAEPPATDTAPPGTDTVPPPPPPQEITLTGAERILLFATSPDGNNAWLVPAYRFTTPDGPGPTVLAVADQFLTPATVTEGGR